MKWSRDRWRRGTECWTTDNSEHTDSGSGGGVFLYFFFIWESIQYKTPCVTLISSTESFTFPIHLIRFIEGLSCPDAVLGTQRIQENQTRSLTTRNSLPQGRGGGGGYTETSAIPRQSEAFQQCFIVCSEYRKALRTSLSLSPPSLTANHSLINVDHWMARLVINLAGDWN